MIDFRNHMNIQFVIADVKRVVCTVAVFLFVASTASAHDVDRDKGAYLGLRLIGTGIYVDEAEDALFTIEEEGGGMELYGGYSFNRVFSLELALSAAAHETSDPEVDALFSALQIFAQYRFAYGHALRPYVKGGLGIYGMRLEKGGLIARAGGGGAAFGAGADYFFSNHFSIGLDLTHNIIKYTDAELEFEGNTVGTEIDENGALTSLGFSLAFYF